MAAKATISKRVVRRKPKVETPEPVETQAKPEEKTQPKISAEFYVPMPKMSELAAKEWRGCTRFGNLWINGKLAVLHHKLAQKVMFYPHVENPHIRTFRWFLDAYKNMLLAGITGKELGKQVVQDQIFDYLQPLAKQVKVDLKAIWAEIL